MCAFLGVLLLYSYFYLSYSTIWVADCKELNPPGTRTGPGGQKQILAIRKDNFDKFLFSKNQNGKITKKIKMEKLQQKIKIKDNQQSSKMTRRIPKTSKV